MRSDREIAASSQQAHRIINNVALELAQATDEDLDVSIERLLGAVAASDGADRGYVQLFDDDRRNLRCIQEWNRSQVAPRFEDIAQYPTLGLSFSVTRILNNLPVHVPDVNALPPEGSGERDAMARHGIFSTLLVPLVQDGVVIGIIGFDGVRGSVHWPDTSIENVRTIGESIVRALERRDVANTLEAARFDAERANNAKNYFLSRMSHELRTPLNAILGFTELLLESGERPNAEVESLEHIRVAGRHLVALIDDVLDISRIESGRVPVKIKAVSLDQALGRALEMVRSSGVADDVTLSIADSACGLVVDADETRLDQVFVNVLSNAAKYNVAGGSVVVTCSAAGAQTASVSIVDTGIGISDENLPRLFEPFDRLGQEDSTVQGTGVGMSLVKTLMETMNGDISVTSELGVGTTVELRLPLTLQARPELYAEAPRQGLPGEPQTQRVVAVERDAAASAILRRIIEHHHGLSLRIVESVEHLRMAPSDVVLVSADVSADAFEQLSAQAGHTGASLHRLVKPYRIGAVAAVLPHAAAA